MTVAEERVWNKLAPRYERLVRPLAGRYDAVRQRLLRDLPAEGSTLELAAGTGQFTETIAEVSRRVVASDLSPAMVEQLFERMAGVDHVEVRVMSAYAIDAQDGQFDAVVCANALHVMEHPEKALSEIHRVLSSEGVLIAPTFCHGQSRLARVISWALTRVSAFEVYTRFSSDTLATTIAASGFRIEACENLGGILPLAYVVARRVEPGETNEQPRSGS